MKEGKVKFFNESKGYGFIKDVESDEEYFVHVSGLIDKIGYADAAIDWAKSMAGIEKAKVVMYHRPLATKPNIYSSTHSSVSGPLVNIDLPKFLDTGRTQFLYLWQPEL